MGNLETQNDDPDESQDEHLVSIHDVLWLNEGYWHLWAKLTGLSCKAHIPEKTHSNQVSRGLAAGWEGSGVCPALGDPQGRGRQAQGQASKVFLSGWGFGPKPP